MMFSNQNGLGPLGIKLGRDRISRA